MGVWDETQGARNPKAPGTLTYGVEGVAPGVTMTTDGNLTITGTFTSPAGTGGVTIPPVTPTNPPTPTPTPPPVSGAAVPRWFSVVDYGAKGDGTTDDTVAIRNAFAAASAVFGGVVYFPNGRASASGTTYKVTDEITFPDNVTALGDGPKATIIAQATSSKSVFKGNNVQRWAVKDLWFEHSPGHTVGTATAIKFTTDYTGIAGTPYGELDNVTINEFPTAVELQNTFVTNINRTVAQNCTTGFYVHGAVPTGSAGTSVTFDSAYAISCTTGFNIYTMTYCVLNACAADHCTTGYLLTNDNGVVMSGCGAEYSAGDSGLTQPKAISVVGGKGIAIDGFFIYNNLYGFLDVSSSAQNVQARACVEINDLGTPTFFIRAASGCYVTPFGCNHSTANSFAADSNRFPIEDSTVWLMKSGQSTVTLDNFGGVLCSNATLALTTVGNQIRIAEGTNGCMGTAVLVGGTKQVNNTSVNSNSRIVLTRSTTGGTAGHLSYTINSGVSFTINSSSGTDTSTINYVIFQAA